MNLGGILLGLVLISGAILPYSYIQANADSPHYFKSKRPSFAATDFENAAIALSSATAENNDHFNYGLIRSSSQTHTDKITLCHVPGNTNKAHSIAVSGNAVFAHMAHGDYLGACDSDIEFVQNDITVITSSNTAVILLHDKILELQSISSVESLKKQISSVATLHKFLADADKKDRKEFQKLFDDYKKLVKQLLDKSDKQSKRSIESMLKQTENSFKSLQKEFKHNDKSKHNGRD